VLRGRLVPIVPIARARARRIVTVTVAIRATPCSGGDGRNGQRAPPEDHHPLGLLGLDTGGPLVATISAATPKTVAAAVARTVASTVAAALTAAVAAAVAAATPL
jgi:hypothetical protein